MTKPRTPRSNLSADELLQRLREDTSGYLLDGNHLFLKAGKLRDHERATLLEAGYSGFGERQEYPELSARIASDPSQKWLEVTQPELVEQVTTQLQAEAQQVLAELGQNSAAFRVVSTINYRPVTPSLQLVEPQRYHREMDILQRTGYMQGERIINANLQEAVRKHFVQELQEMFAPWLNTPDLWWLDAGHSVSMIQLRIEHPPAGAADLIERSGLGSFYEGSSYSPEAKIVFDDAELIAPVVNALRERSEAAWDWAETIPDAWHMNERGELFFDTEMINPYTLPEKRLIAAEKGYHIYRYNHLSRHFGSNDRQGDGAFLCDDSERRERMILYLQRRADAAAATIMEGPFRLLRYKGEGRETRLYLNLNLFGAEDGLGSDHIAALIAANYIRYERPGEYTILHDPMREQLIAAYAASPLQQTDRLQGQSLMDALYALREDANYSMSRGWFFFREDMPDQLRETLQQEGWITEKGDNLWITDSFCSAMLRKAAQSAFLGQEYNEQHRSDQESRRILTHFTAAGWGERNRQQREGASTEEGRSL